MFVSQGLHFVYGSYTVDNKDLVLIRCPGLVLHLLFFCQGEKVMADDEFTCDLFRFLQLLCEGHNNG